MPFDQFTIEQLAGDLLPAAGEYTVEAMAPALLATRAASDT